ncbi:hypothetical protein QJS10_CPA02g00906 [Acorus calamus]|uniref:Uncharacterized protein n=1 Tax=Acorus calamus TaxID=4465 RepID=A0AAV9FD44_ACOCL|nr:hypothetical protein QJS10_CPA02g00906 [Acorus calamus]
MDPKKRVRPTASNRKKEEVVVEDVEEDSNINEASLKGHFQGGPINNDLLVDYQHHASYRIWNDKVHIGDWVMLQYERE